MGRKATITKEVILDAAFNMLRRDGVDSVNIYKISKEIGCSTQPIAWHFGNMDTLRIELARRASNFLNNQAKNTLSEYKAEYPSDAFLRVGEAQALLLFDDPHLVEFVRFVNKGKENTMTVNQILESPSNIELMHGICKEFNLEEDVVKNIMRTILVYVQGIISMMISGMLGHDKEEVHNMLVELSVSLFVAAGVDKELCGVHLRSKS